MKKLLLFSIFIIELYSQSELLDGAPEFYICVEGFADWSEHEFKIEEVSSITYCNSDWPDYTFVNCDNCCDCLTMDVEEVIVGPGGAGCHQDGWGICSWGTGTKEPWYGWGVYKITYLNNGDYFYIDFRDDNYSIFGGDYATDLKVFYIEDHFEWYPQYDNGNFQVINNGQLIKIWERRSNYIPRTSRFPSFWQNCLVIGWHENDDIQIIWGKNPNQGFITKYYLNRKINTGSFIKIGEFNSQTFNYEDKSVKVNDNYYNTVSYYITSYNGTESSPTNTATMEWLEFDWNNGLILNRSGNHPMLVWVPYQASGFTVTNYKLYRAISEEPANPLSLTYTLITTTNGNTYNYIDDAISLTGSDIYVYYYVKAYRTSPSPNYSSATNYVNTEAADLFKEIKAEKEEIKEFILSQNYPNPFNPTTTIEYNLRENGFVTLKIMDILGNEVAELVKEEKPVGHYKHCFDGGNLTSGLYFYSISTGGFFQTKKMMLVK